MKPGGCGYYWRGRGHRRGWLGCGQPRFPPSAASAPVSVIRIAVAASSSLSLPEIAVSSCPVVGAADRTVHTGGVPFHRTCRQMSVNAGGVIILGGTNWLCGFCD